MSPSTTSSFNRTTISNSSSASNPQSYARNSQNSISTSTPPSSPSSPSSSNQPKTQNDELLLLKITRQKLNLVLAGDNSNLQINSNLNLNQGSHSFSVSSSSTSSSSFSRDDTILSDEDRREEEMELDPFNMEGNTYHIENVHQGKKELKQKVNLSVPGSRGGRNSLRQLVLLQNCYDTLREFWSSTTSPAQDYHHQESHSNIESTLRTKAEQVPDFSTSSSTEAEEEGWTLERYDPERAWLEGILGEMALDSEEDDLEEDSNSEFHHQHRFSSSSSSDRRGSEVVGEVVEREVSKDADDSGFLEASRYRISNSTGVKNSNWFRSTSSVTSSSNFINLNKSFPSQLMIPSFNSLHPAISLPSPTSISKPSSPIDLPLPLSPPSSPISVSTIDLSYSPTSPSFYPPALTPDSSPPQTYISILNSRFDRFEDIDRGEFRGINSWELEGGEEKRVGLFDLDLSWEKNLEGTKKEEENFRISRISTSSTMNTASNLTTSLLNSDSYPHIFKSLNTFTTSQATPGEKYQAHTSSTTSTKIYLESSIVSPLNLSSIEPPYEINYNLSWSKQGGGSGKIVKEF